MFFSCTIHLLRSWGTLQASWMLEGAVFFSDCKHSQSSEIFFIGIHLNQNETFLWPSYNILIFCLEILHIFPSKWIIYTHMKSEELVHFLSMCCSDSSRCANTPSVFPHVSISHLVASLCSHGYWLNNRGND